MSPDTIIKLAFVLAIAVVLVWTLYEPSPD